MTILKCMTEVNETLIQKVAELARLELSADETAEYAKSIGEILKHIDQLNQVPVEGVEPMIYGIDGSLRLRPDEVVPFPPGRDGEPKILESAPEVVHGGFKVPQILG